LMVRGSGGVCNGGRGGVRRRVVYTSVCVCVCVVCVVCACVRDMHE